VTGQVYGEVHWHESPFYPAMADSKEQPVCTPIKETMDDSKDNAFSDGAPSPHSPTCLAGSASERSLVSTALD
jgi:hypothetical protein